MFPSGQRGIEHDPFCGCPVISLHVRLGCSSLVLQDHADYIDLNLGCPQRIAKRGYYGAFLMDNLELVKQLVTAAATQLKTPVSVKIRLFPELQTTIDYALMLQQAGASLLAVHGRTRDMKVCCTLAPRSAPHLLYGTLGECQTL